MGRLYTVILIALMLAGPATAAEEGFFAPESEAAGWLWPAAFSLYLSRTVAWDFPAAYLIDTPRVVSALLGRREADTAGDLVSDLRDPYLTEKGPIAAELRRRTGQDFGYADSSPWLERQRAIARWAEWQRKSRSK